MLPITVLAQSPAIDAVYSSPFSLEYIVTLTPGRLDCSLKVRNIAGKESKDTVNFLALLHSCKHSNLPCNQPANTLRTDLATPNSALTSVSPLTNLSYSDKTLPFPHELHTETRSLVRVTEETDRIYRKVPRNIEVVYDCESDKKAGVRVELIGDEFSDTVVWNPREVTGGKLKDMEGGGWYVSSL